MRVLMHHDPFIYHPSNTISGSGSGNKRQEGGDLNRSGTSKQERDEIWSPPQHHTATTITTLGRSPHHPLDVHHHHHWRLGLLLGGSRQGERREITEREREREA
ncbi:hypothetical protein YC2023_071130 [Brassica napus]